MPEEVVSIAALRCLENELGQEMLSSVIDRFLRESKAEIDSLASCDLSSQLIDANRKAHDIAGSSATVGATKLSEAARRMELSCKKCDLEGAMQAREDMAAAFEETATSLSDFLA